MEKVEVIRRKAGNRRIEIRWEQKRPRATDHIEEPDDSRDNARNHRYPVAPIYLAGGRRSFDSSLGLLPKAFIEAGDGRFVGDSIPHPVWATDWHSDIVIEAIEPP